MKKKTSNLASTKTPSFWISLLLGFSVALADNYVGFPIAAVLAVTLYFFCTQVSWSNQKIEI